MSKSILEKIKNILNTELFAGKIYVGNDIEVTVVKDMKDEEVVVVQTTDEPSVGLHGCIIANIYKNGEVKYTPLYESFLTKNKKDFYVMIDKIVKGVKQL
jgi:hypothetical protein